MKSFMLRAEDVNREWHHVDASGKVLGRLASKVAEKLIGKHKPNYTFHIDGGDFVVVTNAKDITISGKKLKDKVYYRHSTKPGNLKSRTFEEMMDKDPRKVIEFAVRRMLPKNRIGRHMYSRLKVYSNEEHKHDAQKPKALEV